MPYYTLLYSGVPVEQTYDELIEEGFDNDFTPPPPDVATNPDGINQLLKQYSKGTMYHNVALHKVYTHFSPKLGLQFSIRRNAQCQKIDLTVPLPESKKIGRHYLATI